MLASHGRYPCAPFKYRPDFQWPDGKRLAVYVAVNVEHLPYELVASFPSRSSLSRWPRWKSTEENMRLRGDCCWAVRAKRASRRNERPTDHIYCTIRYSH